jgi:hypothetical protein
MEADTELHEYLEAMEEEGNDSISIVCDMPQYIVLIPICAISSVY